MVSETETSVDIKSPSAAEAMSLDETRPSDPVAVDANGYPEAKRAREGEEASDIDASKKQKVDESVEEEKTEKMEEGNDGGEEELAAAGPVTVGPKTFASSMEMFDYFFQLLHHWSPNVNTNKYEHLVLLDLIKKGHPYPEKKIGIGAKAFQIRFHPEFKSRCFFIIREDQSVDDFSFRKCVDNILPLPENKKPMSGDRFRNRGGGGGGRSRGRGRGGRGGNYRR